MTMRMMALALVGGVAVVAGPQGASLSVCVGADRVLRQRVGATCPAGAQSYELAPLGSAAAAQPGGQSQSLEQQVADLKQRLAMTNAKLQELQKAFGEAANAQSGAKVVAPFTVVSKTGRTLLTLAENPDGGGLLTLLNASGKPVLWASALNAGGFVKTRGSSNFPEAVLGTNGTSGGVFVRDAEQKSRISMMLVGGNASVEVSNPSHVVVASLRHNQTGDGRLDLGNVEGKGIVSAGGSTKGCGMVQTFPPRAANATTLGKPSDMILGSC